MIEGESYPDFRSYGCPPYRLVVVHGGPGAPGEMASVAARLAVDGRGVLEPLQKQSTLDGQVSELHKVINQNCNFPFVLIGWSWGAFLSFIFTSRYPDLVKKLILIGSGPFEKNYATTIMPTLLSRLSQKDQDKVNIENLKEYARILFQAETYNPTVTESISLEYQLDLHQKVMAEFNIFRNNGKLLNCGKLIKCPVVALHGDYDPHPYQGVVEPLTSILKDFKAILLKDCGHYPWLEKHAFDEFYVLLENEIHH